MIIAVWEIDTKALRRAAESQLVELRAQVEAAWAKMEALGDQHERKGEPVSYLFVAPEYLFTGKDSHFMPEADKEIVLAGLAALSTQFPKLLLVAGSVGWYKTAQRSPATHERRRLEHGGQASASTDGKAPAQAENEASRDLAKYIGKIESFSGALQSYSGWLREVTPDIRDGIAQSYDRGYRDAIFHQQQALNFTSTTEPTSMRVRLQKSDPSTRIARNTCFVYAHGKLLHKYHKVFEAIDWGYDVDIEESDREQPILLLPGDSMPVLTHQGLSYGLELCADHSAAALKIHTQKITLCPVAVQIVMSASTGIDALAVVATELLIHADSGGASVKTVTPSIDLVEIDCAKDVHIYSHLL